MKFDGTWCMRINSLLTLTVPWVSLALRVKYTETKLTFAPQISVNANSVAVLSVPAAPNLWMFYSLA